MYDRIRLKPSGASTPAARAVNEETEASDHAAALRLSRALIRRAAAAPADVTSDDAQIVARAGVSGSGVDLPHRAAMEERFGRSFDGARDSSSPSSTPSARTSSCSSILASSRSRGVEASEEGRGGRQRRQVARRARVRGGLRPCAASNRHDHVQVGGNIVDRMEARGGPPIKLNDYDGHTADPSKAGTYKLGEGKSHVTKAWSTSQIPWGAPIRESLGDIQFQDLEGKWQWATGDRSRLNEPFNKEDFLIDPRDPSQGYITDWKENDFGAVAFKLQGSPGLFNHTTPRSEEVFEQGGQEELTHSHGCLHVQPSDRQRLIDRGYLAKGVKIVIKKYSASLDFGATNK